jgi:hypothetical protein
MVTIKFMKIELVISPGFGQFELKGDDFFNSFRAIDM